MSASPEELERLIRHLRGKPQKASETIGSLRREFKTDDCTAADYLELLRAFLPSWQLKTDSTDESSK